MKLTIYYVIGFILLLGGCAGVYGPKGMAGGYSEKPVDSTTFFLRYDGAPIAGVAATFEQIEPLWHRRAEELCGSKDYYQESRQVRLDPNDYETPLGGPVILGRVYCNNRFVDTRRQNLDENFTQMQNMPIEAFSHKDISPLWELLMSRKYAELQSEVTKLGTELGEDETAELLDTFSRINPVAEERFSEWVKSYPTSSIAYYARAEFYHGYSWFKRGNALSNKLTQEQLDGFKQYGKLAATDIERSLALTPNFCLAHALKLQIHTSLDGSTPNEFKDAFKIASQACPKSIRIRLAYLRFQLPRWHGSKEQMRSFIDESIRENKDMRVLEAFYAAEEGDQFLFSNALDKALDKYDEALAYGNFPSLHVQRGFTLEKLRRFVEAAEDYDAATRMSPYNESAYQGLTRVFLNQGNWVGALTASSYCAALNNQDASVFELQGDIFYQMRRYEDALISFRKAAILSSDKAVHRHKIRMTEFQIEIRSNAKNGKPAKTST